MAEEKVKGEAKSRLPVIVFVRGDHQMK